jgi:hypothetical protein
MKNIFYFVLVILINSCSSGHKLKNTDGSKKNDNSKQTEPISAKGEVKTSGSTQMIFRIRTDTLSTIKKDNLTIALEFKNITDEDIKILNLFDQMSIGFSLLITSPDGSAIILLGPALADFPVWTEFNYISISPGKSYFHLLNVSSLLQAKNLILANKKYEIRMTYFAFNGKNCINGKFESEPITISLNN